ncbi:hypothetical protein HPB50_001840 [Hyalomma asiaticum]|uniref:Uncharacterized protein n=1 Tax=Hyalomma asiaticum TaxID=266040 RepID=A0ACB7SLX4_HYAAI|nr:hypothetical protein HPB50_001840 [Hyalomma asiaticum]
MVYERTGGGTASPGMASVHTTREGTAATRFATSSMYGRAPPGASTPSGVSNGRRKASDLFAPVERTSSPSGRSELTAWCVACGAFVFILFALASAQEIYSRFVHRQHLPSSTRQNTLVDAVSLRPKMRAAANLTGNSVAMIADADRGHPMFDKRLRSDHNVSSRK